LVFTNALGFALYHVVSITFFALLCGITELGMRWPGVADLTDSSC